MNNFIFAYLKEEGSLKFSADLNKTDTIFLGTTEDKLTQVNNLDDTSKQNIMCAFELDNAYMSEEDTDIFLIGDPYFHNTNNTKSFVEIIHDNDPQRIFAELSGAFTWCKMDFPQKKVDICTDLFGQLPVFYFENSELFVVSTSVQLLLETFPSIPRTIEIERIIEFTVTGKIHDQNDSFFKYIHRLPGNKKLTYDFKTEKVNVANLVSLESYRDTSKKLTSEGLREDLKEVIKSATYGKKTAYTASGGVDSTLIAAIGATIEDNPLACYTSSTGYGNDLSFSRKSVEYIDGKLSEVTMDYAADKLDFIYEVTKAHGMPIPIRGSSIAFPLICQAIKNDNMEIVLNGTSETFISGGLYPGYIGPAYFRYCAQRFNWKELVSLVPIYTKHHIMSKRAMLSELFKSWFVYGDTDMHVQESLSGKDFSRFFKEEIQNIRKKMRVDRVIFMDYKTDLLYQMTDGATQKVMFQSYQAGVVNNIHSRTPFLDTRLVKYMDVDEDIRFHSKFDKQFARDAMKEIMDESVVYREDNEGLRWRSTVLLKENKKQIIHEIKSSKFLKTILSEKTYNKLETLTFRKSVLLSLYSVALFDKAFNISLD